MVDRSVLRVVTAHRPPLVYSNSNDSSTFTGFLVDLLPRLLQEAGVQRPFELTELQGVRAGSCLPCTPCAAMLGTSGGDFAGHWRRCCHATQATAGKLLDNGTWTGVMGELTQGRADLALFPLTLTLDREPAIDTIGAANHPLFLQ